MKQAIAGVAPPELGEATAMTVWPSLSVMPLGRWLGRLYADRSGPNAYLTVGKMHMAGSVPLALGLYFYLRRPFGCLRYTLTNRRVVIQLGLKPKADRSIALDEFDTVEIEVQPGQAWFHAGDLVFRRGKTEVFRLEAVKRPEAFRQTCLKARNAYVGVKRALELQAAS
jgi:hypothetical protein